jgi:hypothetical protein
MVPAKVLPPGLSYATVEKDWVVEVITRVVFGTVAAPGRSTPSRCDDTGHVPRDLT